MRFLSTIFYMVLSILGLSVVSLGVLIGVQLYRGKITGTDLHSLMRVIGGTHRIVIPSEQFERFREFAKDEAAARAELELNRGLPETRVPAAMRARDAMAAQQNDLAMANRQLAAEKELVENLRSQVEARKNEIATLRRALDDEREKNALVEQDEATAKLRKTLSEMEAGDIGAFLAQVIRDPSQGGPPEAARIIRQHLRADFSAEVLGEMPEQERQLVLPLLENRFAGVPPDAVVRIFADQKLSPGEQMAHMMQMNPQQALGVYLRLPPDVQERISPRILRM